MGVPENTGIVPHMAWARLLRPNNAFAADRGRCVDNSGSSPRIATRLRGEMGVNPVQKQAG